MRLSNISEEKKINEFEDVAVKLPKIKFTEKS
jgi:hypothetical protein